MSGIGEADLMIPRWFKSDVQCKKDLEERIEYERINLERYYEEKARNQMDIANTLAAIATMEDTLSNLEK